MSNYPEKPIFNSEKDNKGNNYLKAYSNKEGACVITLKGKNTQLKGRTNLFIRKGNSKFGNELCFYFKVEDIEKEYDTDTKHECIEFYLPKEYGIEFLEQALKHFKENMS